ncbi:MAG: hypothetical protein A3E87_05405 [Gammaproteobacteria bacterium RIFCSPHIGHO2_12_FULL_35_23]|nr:MAG: hypothetical protein A3E87_05405 [Gammaproteobacteria bacterium RIFCSPHIGHO2_12_FULL_35_23]
MFTFNMAQFLKDHVRDAIIDAALYEFAKHGFSGASIAGIAERSGISTGNVYRYFASKAKLFDAAVPRSFVQAFLKRFRQRIAAYPVGTQPDKIPKHSPYLRFSEELLEFTITNRLRVLIILEGTDGTVHEGFSTKLQTELSKNAIQTLGLTKLTNNSTIIFALLRDVYRNYFLALGSILRRFSDESDIRTAIDIYSKYHLGGLAMIAS